METDQNAYTSDHPCSFRGFRKDLLKPLIYQKPVVQLSVINEPLNCISNPFAMRAVYFEAVDYQEGLPGLRLKRQRTGCWGEELPLASPKGGKVKSSGVEKVHVSCRLSHAVCMDLMSKFYLITCSSHICKQIGS